MTCRPMILGILLCAALCLASGCGDSVSRPASEQPGDESIPAAPELPPVASMQFGLDAFGAPARTAMEPLGASGSAAAGARARSMGNWWQAAVRVAVIDLVVAAAVTPPALAFGAALNAEPEYLGAGTWRWTYLWTAADGDQVEIRLTGTLETDRVHWELRLREELTAPPEESLVWFYGASFHGEERGYWIFNELGTGAAVPVARVDWDVRGPQDEELRFECIAVGSDDDGDRLVSFVDGARHTLEFYDASEAIFADIGWNAVTGAGSLQVPDYNGGERACWDTNRQDVECPADPI